MNSELAHIAKEAVIAPDAHIGPFCVLGFAPETHGTLAAKIEAGAQQKAKQAGPAESREALAPLVLGKQALIRTHTVIYCGSRVGERFQTGHHVLIREGCRIGDDVSIGTSSIVEHHVVIADGVRLHSHCFVPEFSILEEGAWLGPGVTLTNAPFPRGRLTKERLSGPIIEKGAKIGAAAVLLPGVRIGTGALVGAGAVVTRDVKAGGVVAGNPARLRQMVGELRYEDDAQPYPDEDS